MTSFISSSKPQGTLALTLALILAMALLEVTTRAVLIPRSKDLSRFGTYAGRAVELTSAPATRLALVGNSTTERGVELTTLRRALVERGGGPIAVDMFVADASQINTWYYLLKRYFWDPGLQPPDLCVVTFYGIGLRDGRPEVGRLAKNFTTLADWSEVFRTDLPDWTDRLDFATSTLWATFAARERIKERTLGSVIPHYHEFARRVNEDLRQHERLAAGAKARGPVAATKQAHGALKRFLDEAKRRGTRLCFVAFPVLEHYELDPVAVDLIRRAGIPLIDLRILEGIRPSMYEDDIHMDAAGRGLYSRRLAERLEPLLRNASPRD